VQFNKLGAEEMSFDLLLEKIRNKKALFGNSVLLLFLFVFISCCFSFSQGQDANWDMLNYHLYNPYSFLNGRFYKDILPAGYIFF
jgi:hypothetical protein